MALKVALLPGLGQLAPVGRKLICVRSIDNREVKIRSRCYTQRVITLQPLISKRDILETYRPGRDPAETLFRSLKNNKWVSDGLAVVTQDERGRLSGTFRLYCALNKDAARLARLGRPDDARKLAVLAGRIEKSKPAKQIVDALVAFVGASRDDEAVTDAFRSVITHRRDLWTAVSDLGTRIEQGRAGARDQHGVHFFGVVSALTGDGTAEIVEERGGRRVLLPRAELAERGLDHKGQAVAIHWEPFGPGRTLTEAEPALRLDVAERSFLNSRLDLSDGDLAAIRAKGPTVEIRQPVIRS